MISGGISEIKCDKCGVTYDFKDDITTSLNDVIDEIEEYGWTVPEIDAGGPIFGMSFDCFCPDCSAEKDRGDE